jgi:hypothetical protein
MTGWFVTDIITADTPDVERKIQEIRVDGIVQRARGLDPRFSDHQKAGASLTSWRRRR